MALPRYEKEIVLFPEWQPYGRGHSPGPPPHEWVEENTINMLITLLWPDGTRHVVAGYRSKRRWYDYGGNRLGGTVLAWAYMPKPYTADLNRQELIDFMATMEAQG